MRWTEEDKKEALRLWGAGETYAEIGRRLEKTRGSVSSFLQRSEAKAKGKVYSRPRKSNMRFAGRRLERPTSETVRVEDPPQDVPPPDGAKFTPWIDLQLDECQWALNGFWDGPSHEMPCCGQKVEGKTRFCSYHLEWSKAK
jgi:hypothetical protein